MMGSLGYLLRFPAFCVNAVPAHIYAMVITQDIAGGMLVGTAGNMPSLALSVGR